MWFSIIIVFVVCYFGFAFFLFLCYVFVTHSIIYVQGVVPATVEISTETTGVPATTEENYTTEAEKEKDDKQSVDSTKVSTIYTQLLSFKQSLSLSSLYTIVTPKHFSPYEL